MTLRDCKTCREPKRPDDFYASHPGTCKACQSERRRARYQAQREATLAQMAEYGRRNREVVNAASRRYRAKHRDAVNHRARQKRITDGERARLRGRENSQRRRARVAAATVAAIRPDLLIQKMAFHGGLCWICREAPATEWDHVKPIAAGGAHILSNLRPSCQPCNRRKWHSWPFSREDLKR